MNIQVATPAELDKVVAALSALIDKGHRIFLLSGPLGAGKTRLVQAFGEHANVPEGISSPTFSLINAYDSATYGVIYHMDLYRLEKAEDLVQIGLEEYLDSGNICFIEWPAVAASYLTPPYVRVEIAVDTHNIRIFKITTHDALDA